MGELAFTKPRPLEETDVLDGSPAGFPWSTDGCSTMLALFAGPVRPSCT